MKKRTSGHGRQQLFLLNQALCERAKEVAWAQRKSFSLWMEEAISEKLEADEVRSLLPERTGEISHEKESDL
jgi:hypothetical protein